MSRLPTLPFPFRLFFRIRWRHQTTSGNRVVSGSTLLGRGCNVSEISSGGALQLRAHPGIFERGPGQSKCSTQGDRVRTLRNDSKRILKGESIQEKESSNEDEIFNIQTDIVLKSRGLSLKYLESSRR
ncbi:hypothetical protein TNCV_2623161 [Trichonephila clavipes]|nr:hypothetical protein TNCV_2623161 [Trichonephila clavipes]